MSQLVIRVVTAFPAPGCESVIATVEVLSGEPVVGNLLHQGDHADSWAIVGFGHTPPAYHSRGLIDLILKPASEQKDLPEGTLLVENTHQSPLAR